MILLEELGGHSGRSGRTWFLFMESLHFPMCMLEIVCYFPSRFFIRITLPLHQVFVTTIFILFSFNNFIFFFFFFSFSFLFHLFPRLCQHSAGFFMAGKC